MAGSPQFKIYTAAKEYVAACKHASDAVMLAAAYGAGAKIKYGHSMVVWTEGSEEASAAESYDAATYTILQRIHAKNVRSMERLDAWRAQQ
jgi:uncharacterized protein YneR